MKHLLQIMKENKLMMKKKSGDGGRGNKHMAIVRPFLSFLSSPTNHCREQNQTKLVPLLVGL